MGKQDKPDLFDMPVILTLVCEDDETGEVVEALYAECNVDLTSIGLDIQALKTVREIFPTLHRFFGDKTLRLATVSVPKLIAGVMSRLLPGMTRNDGKLVQFVYRIRD